MTVGACPRAADVPSREAAARVRARVSERINGVIPLSMNKFRSRFNPDRRWREPHDALALDDGRRVGSDDAHPAAGLAPGRVSDLRLPLRRAGARLSTLDLFGDGYVLLAGPRSAVRGTPGPGRGGPQASARLQVAGVDFEFADEGVDWAALTGLPEDGSALVRPDGFVADRSDQTERPA